MAAEPAHKHATPPSPPLPSPPIFACAFYIAACGFTTDAARLLPTCRKLGCDEGEESLLRGLIVGEMKIEQGGGAVGRPRLHAAARAGSAGRVAALVRAGARVDALNEGGRTVLMVAVDWRRKGVLRELLTTAGVETALVCARIADGNANAGHSAFSLACYWARDSGRKLTENTRAAAGACARTLAASPYTGPCNLGGGDGTALLWACEARLDDVVRSWLDDPRCTVALVAQRDAYGRSAFFNACYWAQDRDRILNESERDAAAACARILAASPYTGPRDVGGSDGTALRWACEARLDDVVRSWLGDPCCTVALVAQRDAHGRSLFFSSCHATRNASGLLNESERAAAAACATHLALRHKPSDVLAQGAGGNALLWACHARLAHVVAAWVTSTDCTREELTHRASDGASPFSAACLAARNASRSLSPVERIMGAHCARIIAASSHMIPEDLGEHGGTALFWASWAGLHDVLVKLLASPHCTRAVMTVLNEGGETAFSAACEWAGDTERVLSVSERADAVACAKALAASPHLCPADTSHGGRTALSSACGAGLVDIVSAMLADAHCSEAVVTREDMRGRTAASELLSRCTEADTLSSDERRDTAACARALAKSRHLLQPIRTQLKAAALLMASISWSPPS